MVTSEFAEGQSCVNRTLGRMLSDFAFSSVCLFTAKDNGDITMTHEKRTVVFTITVKTPGNDRSLNAGCNCHLADPAIVTSAEDAFPLWYPMSHA